MSNDTFPLKVGIFECVAISDGTFTYGPPTFPPPATLLFSNASEAPLELALREHNLRPDQWVKWISPYICLLIKTGEHQVLVDTGAGALDPDTGKLLQNLRAERIEPEDIDTVILTHAHPDHIGGNTDAKGMPAFPNAQYIMWKDEWDFWTSGQAELKLDEHSRDTLVTFARNNLPPIQDRLILIDHETEILPGIKAIVAPGHTPGHMVLSISSQDKQLLCLSDAVLHPIHLEHPDWYATVDLAPEQTVTTRRQLLNLAATEKALVLGFHLPFPGLGYVVQKGEAWQWQPFEIAS